MIRRKHKKEEEESDEKELPIYKHKEKLMEHLLENKVSRLL